MLTCSVDVATIVLVNARRKACAEFQTPSPMAVQVAAPPNGISSAKVNGKPVKSRNQLKRQKAKQRKAHKVSVFWHVVAVMLTVN